jgi:hypothetical protein
MGSRSLSTTRVDRITKCSARQWDVADTALRSANSSHLSHRILWGTAAVGQVPTAADLRKARRNKDWDGLLKLSQPARTPRQATPIYDG